MIWPWPREDLPNSKQSPEVPADESKSPNWYGPWCQGCCCSSGSCSSPWSCRQTAGLSNPGSTSNDGHPRQQQVGHFGRLWTHSDTGENIIKISFSFNFQLKNFAEKCEEIVSNSSGVFALDIPLIIPWLAAKPYITNQSSHNNGVTKKNDVAITCPFQNFQTHFQRVYITWFNYVQLCSKETARHVF